MAAARRPPDRRPDRVGNVGISKWGMGLCRNPYHHGSLRANPHRAEPGEDHTMRAVLAFAVLLLAACSSSPKVIEPSADAEEIRVATGTVVQVELPSDERVRSVAIGNPKISATSEGNVVSISASPDASGETNMILRTTSGRSYQYRVVVDR